MDKKSQQIIEMKNEIKELLKEVSNIQEKEKE